MKKTAMEILEEEKNYREPKKIKLDLLLNKNKIGEMDIYLEEFLKNLIEKI
jgi:hypothetical protein